MRHRTAERVSRQTEALVISVSQRREVVSLYLRGRRLTLEDTEVAAREGEPGAADPPELPHAARRGARPAHAPRVRRPRDRRRRRRGDRRASRWCGASPARSRATSASSAPKAGSSGCRPTSSLPASTTQYQLLVRDYAADASLRHAVGGPIATARPAARAAPRDRCRGPRARPDRLGPRRAAPAFARLPGARADPDAAGHGRQSDRRAVRSSLPAMVRASVADLDDVDGVGTRRARAIANGLARIRRTRRSSAIRSLSTQHALAADTPCVASVRGAHVRTTRREVRA